MRISKMMLNFALLTAIASVSATSSASSTCNMRSGNGRFASSNPRPEKAQAKTMNKGQKAYDALIKRNQGKK